MTMLKVCCQKPTFELIFLLLGEELNKRAEQFKILFRFVTKIFQNVCYKLQSSSALVEGSK